MSRIIYLTKTIATICLLAVSSTAIASRPIAADPDWIFHSSFDNMPRKIVDTPDAVYFFVHQRYYDTSAFNGYFNIPTGAIFKLDKNNMTGGLRDLHKTISFSGTDMRLFDVNPETGLMVIAYNDGGIDLVTRDGKVTYISDIRDRTFPGSWNINSISFDPISHDVWLGTGAGFTHISSSTLTPLQSPEWSGNVSDICPVGSKVIAIIDSKVCEANAGTNIARRESFTAIAMDTADTPVRLMPLSANHVAYLASNGSIQLLTLSGAKWTRSQLLGATPTMLQTANSTVTDRMEHAVHRTANGYYISSLHAAHILSGPTESSGIPKLTTRALPPDATLYSASYDLSNYWYYRDRGKFVCRQPLSGSEWQEPSGVFMAEAPLTCKDVTFTYSPEVGFIAVNCDPDLRMGSNDGTFPPLPAAYHNGKWVNLAPSYHTPYIIEEQPSYASILDGLLQRFPVEGPHGFCIDPLFPDIAHMGSSWEGFASMNVGDPKKFPIMNVAPNDNLTKLPARTELRKSTWKTYTGTYCAGFDADNNLWMIKCNSWDTDPSRRNNYSLMYWTPDARRDALLNSDPTLGGKWKSIDIKGDIFAKFWMWAQALSHPANRNKIVFSIHGEPDSGEGRPVFIFDHKGTLDNTADDKLVTFSKFQTRAGQTPGIGYMNDFVEDPNTGDVIACTFNDTFIFNPNTPLNNGLMPAESISVASEFGAGYDFLTPFPASTACFDEYGRLWIAGTNGGVVGMSADRKEVIAHFSTKNSPLPSDNIYGIGWNPDTKSLFISTDMGIVEARVDNKLCATPSGIQDPFLTPDHVGPDYAGTVAIHSLPGGAVLKVIDTDGRTVAHLPRPEHGVTYWDLLDSDGNRVRTGKYIVTDATGNLALKPMTIVVTL